MNTIQKYIWLVDTIRRFKKISLQDLDRKYRANVMLSDGSPLHRQTFIRWKEEISYMFGIDIVCEQGGDYRYYISNPEELEKRGLIQWLFNTYSAINSMENNLCLKGRILTEAVPSSELYLNDIMEAMKENRIIRFSYGKFGCQKQYSCTLHPYSLKLHQQRWYLHGYCEEMDDLRLYGLDRISELSVTDQFFELPHDYDAETYFSSYIGIDTRGDGLNCETITLRANFPHDHYLRSLPLHDSQREIERCEDYTIFQVELCPNYEFYWKLLSMGDYVEVLASESVRCEMVDWLKSIMRNYE